MTPLPFKFSIAPNGEINILGHSEFGSDFPVWNNFVGHVQNSTAAMYSLGYQAEHTQAAITSLGIVDDEDIFEDMQDELQGLYPVLKEFRDCPVLCEETSYRNSLVSLLIIHLNDTHKWSREQIAEWVDGI